MHGPNGWREYKYPGHGPKWIITPRAIFTFDTHGKAQLSATFAGTSPEWVKENTGFSFAVDPEWREAPEPTEEELSVLRREIDPDGVLRH
jgi:acyl CoA:acetate/3-ketoacid CoA transferase beta subunit